MNIFPPQEGGARLLCHCERYSPATQGNAGSSATHYMLDAGGRKNMKQLKDFVTHVVFKMSIKFSENISGSYLV